ncbi:MAG: molybdopterin-dependent oxidoreductase [Chloroflexi bacterium]|nr:molybdopterin-dependent oxidoreductase [Chloroflexota bacterium]MCI0577254.1 molybdopterin-dependent oxidoreductase [Chloroflexota bacterium]MCI0646735.1 molybdopterin-dependent oxidoreductase [Chloroflexota bacterium]MCI0731369.1 molybdopterin-dependent oxidoreductase [Chloroflexota bacterium]
MAKRTVGLGLLAGGLLASALMAIMYLANQALGLPFVPFDLFDWITRVLPGPIITFGIDLMIDTLTLIGLDVADTAKTAEQLSAVLQFFVIGLLAGGLFFVLLRLSRVRGEWPAGLLAGALLGLPLIAISMAIGQSEVHPLLRMAWLAVLFLAWGLALAWAYRGLLAEAPAAVVTGADVDQAGGEVATVETIDRRQFLIRLGASTATITVIGAGLGGVLAAAERRRLSEATTMAHQVDETTLSPFPNANDPVTPVPGTRPEYTPIKDHYKVFIRTEPTVIDGANYTLPITGLVDNPLMLTLDDIRNNFDSFDQYVTLSCISGRVGTTLISTTQWTGVSMQDVLAAAKPRPEARYLIINSGDGFYETVDLELIAAERRIMLCYAWDGHALPVDHGFPLRIWIPDRFGMKQPKWIVSMELVDKYVPGYWVERNWDEVARVNTTSVIDTVAVDHLISQGDQQSVPVGGIAFAGARGISRVEVRVDGGPWQPAQLRSPLSETTWVIWRYEWPFAAGDHTFEVRCTEGDGTPQIEEDRPARPSGSTGIHRREASL